MSNFDSFLKKMMGETEEPQTRNISERKLRTEGVKKQSEAPRSTIQSKPKKSETIIESNDDDIVERAFEYAATFSKIVKKNFPEKSNRRVVLESIKSAINLMLGESIDSVKTASNVRDTLPQRPVEEEDPYEALRRVQLSRLPEDFQPVLDEDLHIKTFTNERGDQEVDLSEMTQDDMYALRVLSGITQPKEKQINE